MLVLLCSQHFQGQNSSAFHIYVPAIDWRDSIIINEFVLPSNNSKAYKRMTDKNNTDTIPKIEGDSPDTPISSWKISFSVPSFV